MVDGEIQNELVNYTIKTLNSSSNFILNWSPLSLPSSNSMLKTSGLNPLQSRSLPYFCSSSLIFITLDGDDLLESSIINIQIIINLMMEYKIYIDVPFSWASSFCKSRRTLSYLAFLTSFKYPPVFLRLSIRFPGSTSFLQYHWCCWSVLCSLKCFRPLVQKCFFSFRL